MSSDRPRGLLLVISSPSGAGKSTLCRRLRKEFPNIGFSVSYTTRKPRTGETDGVEYNFTTPERFTEMVASDAFAEHALVHGNMYGTLAEQVSGALDSGKDLLFDIDFQGGRQLRERFGADVVSIFILPPSLQELESRLRRRGTDERSVIAQRLKVARLELAHYAEYDYVVLNDDLERAYDDLRSIYLAQRLRMHRQRPLAQQLLADGGDPIEVDT